MVKPAMHCQRSCTMQHILQCVSHGETSHALPALMHHAIHHTMFSDTLHSRVLCHPCALRAQVAVEPERWYNTSSPQMGGQGIPHGFALEPIHGACPVFLGPPFCAPSWAYPWVCIPHRWLCPSVCTIHVHGCAKGLKWLHQ